MKKFSLGLSLFGLAFYQQQKKAKCCGIFGIVSEKNKDVKGILCQGIELLKNRGYDSAGIVSFEKSQGSIQPYIIKHADSQPHQLNCIERVVNQMMLRQTLTNIGIGHTRWATCGEKVTKNAHPHYDLKNKIYLVHNGIISNHSELKTNYLKGTVFNSDTDTEVLVQLLGKLINQGKTMLEAVRQLQKIVGHDQQWGIVIIYEKQPNKIYTSTNKSPILIGLSSDQIYVASEMVAFQKHAEQFFETRDGEVFQLCMQNLPAIRKQMAEQGRLKSVDKTAKVMKNPPEGMKSFYEYQINQQAHLGFEPDFERIKAIPFGPYMTILGCGSSYNASHAIKYFFQKMRCFKKINILDPVQLLQGDITQGQTVVLVSQSGQTADLIKIVARCKQIPDVKTIGIINVEGSTLARKVDFPIYIKTGRQYSVGATKSMFHQMLNLAMFATEVAEQKKYDQDFINQVREDLMNIPKLTKLTIESVGEKCKELAQLLYKKQSMFLLALRQGLGIAKEAALKIKQLNYIHAEALGACEMKHGPIALVNSQKKQQTTVILIVQDNDTYSTLTNAVDQMYSRNAFVVIITDCQQKLQLQHEKRLKQDPNAKRNYHFIINVPKVKHMSHILTLIPLQILVKQIAYLKNINPDMPRNLAKTVTV